jgi:hypothetical protein
MGKRGKASFAYPQSFKMLTILTTLIGTVLVVVSFLNGLLKRSNASLNEEFAQAEAELKKSSYSIFDTSPTNYEFYLLSCGSSQSSLKSSFFEVSRRHSEQCIQDFYDASAHSNTPMFMLLSNRLIHESTYVEDSVHNKSLFGGSQFDGKAYLIDKGVKESDIYDDVQSTKEGDILSACMRIREYIEGIAYKFPPLFWLSSYLFLLAALMVLRTSGKSVKGEHRITIRLYSTGFQGELFQSVLNRVFSLIPSLLDSLNIILEVSVNFFIPPLFSFFFYATYFYLSVHW